MHRKDEVRYSQIATDIDSWLENSGLLPDKNVSI